MADPLNNDILDVLSSIRRLVSEDRRHGPGTAAPAPAPAPVPPDAAEEMSIASARESRFVLTAALRVPEDEEGEAEGADAAASDWQRDLDEDHLTAGALASEPPDDHEPTTLEATIAELEAAVANIDTGFEPDGGDPIPEEMADDRGGANINMAPMAEAEPVPPTVTPDLPVADLPVADLVEEAASAPPVVELAFSRPIGFSGIMAGYDAMALHDERLDQPITGEALYTGLAAPFSRARPGDPLVVGPDPAGEDSLSGPETGDGVDIDGPDAPLLGFDADLPDRDDDEEALTDGEAADEGLAAAEAGLGATALFASAQGRLHLGGGDDEDRGEDEGEDRPRLRIYRPTDEDSAPQDTPDLAVTDAAADEAVADAMDEAGQAEDLLDPLGGSDLDLDMLRDMVAELIRQELRGALGERITRNVRGLVRREVERALAQQFGGPDPD